MHVESWKHAVLSLKRQYKPSLNSVNSMNAKKTQSTYDQIVSRLDKLSPREIDHLLVTVKQKRQALKKRDGQGLTPDELLLYSALVDELRKHHKRSIPQDEGKRPLPMMQGFDYELFTKAYLTVHDYLAVTLPELSNQATTDRLAVYRSFCSAVYYYQSEIQYNSDVVEHVFEELEEAEFTALELQRLRNMLHSYRPVGLKAMLQGLQSIDDAIEAAFPDYARSGLLRLLLTTRQKGEQ